MKIAGIIAEYNPFHRGHQWQIAALRQTLGEDTAVVAVMSGNWVQRGDAALVEKHRRAAMALQGGIDLVVELPLTWAVSSAERFAQGGVAVLAATEVVDTLVFGSESGELARLEEMADYLLSEDYRLRLRGQLKTGCSFAAARQRAMEDSGLSIWDTAKAPNDQLALEYLKALRGTELRPLAIRRKGAAHDGEAREGIASASAVRELILSGKTAEDYLLPGTEFAPEELASLRFGERGVLSALRGMQEADFAALPDCSEGLEHRMVRGAREAVSIPQLCQLVKTKRYAYARIRRLVTWSYLGLTKADFAPSPACIRVLGANEAGRGILRRMRKTAALPVVTRPAAGRAMGEGVRRQLELEARATDLWQLCRREIGPGGTEWTQGPVLI